MSTNKSKTLAKEEIIAIIEREILRFAPKERSEVGASNEIAKAIFYKLDEHEVIDANIIIRKLTSNKEPTTMPRTINKEEYVGDGVYARFDGANVWLWSTNGVTKSHEVAINMDNWDAIYNMCKECIGTPEGA
jgi:hypothetical protein